MYSSVTVLIVFLALSVVFGLVIYYFAAKNSYRQKVPTASHLPKAGFSSKSYPGKPPPEFYLHDVEVKGIEGLFVARDIAALKKKGIYEYFEYRATDGSIVDMTKRFTESLESYKARVAYHEIRIGSSGIERIHQTAPYAYQKSYFIAQ